MNQEQIREWNAALEAADGCSSVIDIIQSITQGPYNEGLFKCVERLLERYPKDYGWRFALSPDYSVSNDHLDQITAKWITLNRNEQSMFISTHSSLSRSSIVLESIFEWVRNGGRKSKYMPTVLSNLLQQSRFCEAIRPAIINFAREWLKKNAEHNEAGSVHGAVLSVTKSLSDIRAAKHWYNAQSQNESAWKVISSMLECAYWLSSTPDPYAVKNAKVIIRGETVVEQKPRLIGALVSVFPDAETIGWAKEAYSRHGLGWILSRLLLVAPDPESIRWANEGMEKWVDSSIESMMLYSLLSVEPRNERALGRAKICARKNPQAPYAQELLSFLPDL